MWLSAVARLPKKLRIRIGISFKMEQFYQQHLFAEPLWYDEIRSRFPEVEGGGAKYK